MALTLIAGFPLLAIAAIVAAAVRVRLGSPVLFRQQRPGYAGAVFTMFKFRTMTVGRLAPCCPTLLERVFDIDLQRCPRCGGGQVKIIAAILERAVIGKILTHLGLQPQPPPHSKAREVGHEDAA